MELPTINPSIVILLIASLKLHSNSYRRPASRPRLSFRSSSLHLYVVATTARSHWAMALHDVLLKQVSLPWEYSRCRLNTNGACGEGLIEVP